jgi:hypothetical protein
MRKETRKTTKICLVCGEDFKGTAAAQVCGNACRVALKRILDADKKPEFWLLAKNKGQKLPLVFGVTPKKKETKLADVDVPITPITPESLDIEKPTEPELTKEQKLAKIAQLSNQIDTVRKEQCPQRMHPKTFQLNKEIRISDIETEIEQLKN